MAVDTASKRYSAMQWGSRTLVLPEPDNEISRGDRLHLMGLYGGIEAADPTIPAVTEYNLGSRATVSFATFSDTATNTDPTVIGPIHFKLGGIVERLNFSIKLSGGDAIDLGSFAAECQIDPDGFWIPLQTTWGAAADESGFILHTPDDLENLEHGAVGMAILNPIGFRTIRFKCGFDAAVTNAITRTLEITSVLQARNR